MQHSEQTPRRSGDKRRNNASADKMLALHEMAAADTLSTAVNFYGFGVNSGTLKYQAANITNHFDFYNRNMSLLNPTTQPTKQLPLTDVTFADDYARMITAQDNATLRAKTLVATETVNTIQTYIIL